VTHGVQYGGTQDGHKDLYGEIHYRGPNVGGLFSDVIYWSSKGDQNFRKRRNPKPSPLIRALSTIKRPVVDPAIWRSGGPRHGCACSGHCSLARIGAKNHNSQIDMRARGSTGWPLRWPPESLSASLPMLAHTCRAVPHQ